MKTIAGIAHSLKKGWKAVCASAAVCLFAIPAFAADSDATLYVFLNDGTIDKYLLAEKPVVTFEGDHCLIKTESLTGDYDMAKVHHADFTGNVAIEEIEGTPVEINLSTPGHAVISGLGSDAVADVYSIQGMRLVSAQANANSVIDIDMSDLPGNSIYIISTNKNKSFKFHKK